MFYPQPALADTAEFYRIDAALKLDPRKRSDLGQYMTPVPICRFMASMFSFFPDPMRVLDPGAGVGSLTAALVERVCEEGKPPSALSLICYEIEPLLAGYLRATLAESESRCAAAKILATSEIRTVDFVLDPLRGPQADLFDSADDDGLTHVIMNPPYKKLGSTSEHRLAVRKAGLETSNLYTAFMFLAARRLRQGGELVAIVPRSFCNGPYFKPFRERFFSMMSLRRLHIFATRDSAFKGDEVLQENIILHAVRNASASKVLITASEGGGFYIDKSTGECTVADMTQRRVDYAAVIRPDDPDGFVHIASNDIEQAIIERMGLFTATLGDIGLSVSTGPVVDFRLKTDTRSQPGPGTVPLLYASHFRDGGVEWPIQSKKPNAIQVTASSRRWLWANRGHFVVIKRFTAKEERRRVVAYVYPSHLPGALVGFENHLNVFHAAQEGVSQALAQGLCIYLNSSLVDRYFRQFNGHTQVNATDLRFLRYPSREVLERIGGYGPVSTLSQAGIDNIIEKEIARMSAGENPLNAQEKLDEALLILKALGMPRTQHNERSALTLLALVALKPAGSWRDAGQPLMGITPIMDYCREHYGRDYAPNTRETFRRHTMHQFVEAGLAVYNPDAPARPVNSPKACYQISDEALEVMQTFGTGHWQQALDDFVAGQQRLAAQ
ncbi:MAG: hypothetical protein GKR94_32285 [Gammaproteobacteria bacterium]|nr:hypothetical protein [Gammaproteobacteria bacterium]